MVSGGLFNKKTKSWQPKPRTWWAKERGEGEGKLTAMPKKDAANQPSPNSRKETVERGGGGNNPLRVKKDKGSNRMKEGEEEGIFEKWNALRSGETEEFNGRRLRIHDPGRERSHAFRSKNTGAGRT